MHLCTYVYVKLIAFELAAKFIYVKLIAFELAAKCIYVKLIAFESAAKFSRRRENPVQPRLCNAKNAIFKWLKTRFSLRSRSSPANAKAISFTYVYVRKKHSLDWCIYMCVCVCMSLSMRTYLILFSLKQAILIHACMHVYMHVCSYVIWEEKSARWNLDSERGSTLRTYVWWYVCVYHEPMKTNICLILNKLSVSVPRSIKLLIWSWINYQYLYHAQLNF